MRFGNFALGLLFACVGAPADAGALSDYVKTARSASTSGAKSKPAVGTRTFGRWKPGYVSRSGKYIPGHFTGTHPKHSLSRSGF